MATKDQSHHQIGLRDITLPGLDPRWSRVVRAPDAEGRTRSWHILDNGPVLAARGERAHTTVLAVHGNPTWSYLWRRVLAQAPAGWRVVAVDQLGMGFSERPDLPRTLGQRIDDLSGLTAALDLGGRTVTLAHDWGGPISLGWAQRHRDQLAAVVLTNTAVHQPRDDAPPAVIRLARAPGLLTQVCRRSPAFVRATTALSVPPLRREVRDAFAVPYRGADRRAGVADFVRDIPFETDHPSRATLDAVAEGMEVLSDLPALLVWGPRDPVFSTRYLEDLLARLPRADVQRYEHASHLVLEDAPAGVEVIWRWLQQVVPVDGSGVEPTTPGAAPVTEQIVEPRATPRSTDDQGSTDNPGPEGLDEPEEPDEPVRVPIRVDASRPDEVAVVELSGAGRRITFGQLRDQVDDVARGLAARGVQRGDRVAVLVPPGIDLTTIVYALWRLGAVVVVADAGLGLARLGTALRSAGPRHVVGIRVALALASLTRVPGNQVRIAPGGASVAALADDGAASGLSLPAPDSIEESADGAVLFTSGATGPPKGVVYTRQQLGAQVGLLRQAFGFGPGERFVAAFAPFALYGPALGLSSAVPDMDVTAPHTLTATALAQAVSAVDATMVFAAPAALRNVVATAADLRPEHRSALAQPRLVLSAGAPVPVELLHQVRALLPSAGTQTPYGMTEALPVASLDPTTLDSGPDDAQAGVCVGHPLPGVQVALAPLDAGGIPAEGLTRESGPVGEIVVRGPHIKDRYDRQWGMQERSARPPGWHRTGDVGHLDEHGRLWVEGRLAQVIQAAAGPITPYPVEGRVRGLTGVTDVAAVGIGPLGARLVVLVLVPQERGSRFARLRGAAPGSGVLAPAPLAEQARTAAEVPVAAVLMRDWLPVDVRHASKVDRAALSAWAEGVLHGRGARERLLGALRTSAPRTRSR